MCSLGDSFLDPEEATHANIQFDGLSSTSSLPFSAINFTCFNPLQYFLSLISLFQESLGHFGLLHHHYLRCQHPRKLFSGSDEEL